MKYVHHYIVRVEGTYSDNQLTSVPHIPGIYLVYRVSHNGERILLYIGESSDVSDRLNNFHEKRAEWEKSKSADDQLEYKILTNDFFGSNHIRCSVENAFIFYHKPPVNVEGKDSFNYNDCIDICFDGIVPSGIYPQFRVCGDNKFNKL